MEIKGKSNGQHEKSCVCQRKIVDWVSDIEDFNQTLLAKQAWRLHNESSSFDSSALQGKVTLLQQVFLNRGRVSDYHMHGGVSYLVGSCFSKE